MLKITMAAVDIDQLAAAGRQFPHRAPPRACSSGAPVHRPGVAEKHLAALLIRERQRQGACRIVEIPVRVIGREQEAIPADLLDGIEQVLARLRLLNMRNA
jgi:hypothetical protein